MTQEDEERRRHQREASQRWKARNKERVRVKVKEHYDANRESILAARKERYWANREGELARQKVYRESNPEYHHRRFKLWRDAHKEQAQAVQRTWQAKQGDDYRKRCCVRVHTWMQANPLKRAEQRSRYRALKRNALTDLVDFAFTAKRDRMMCGICHKRVARKDLSFDHIVPLSKGGAHANWNLQVAHSLCNSRRNVGYLPAQMRMAV